MDIVCKPCTEGGLGLSSIEDINEAFMLKLSWESMKWKSKMGKVLAACVYKQSGSVVSFVCTSI